MTQETRGTHTPGPWCVGTKYPARIIGDGQIIAITCPDDTKDCPTEQEKANARFIAAAPDLLDALERLAHWPGKSACVNGTLSRNQAANVANMRRFARAALTKARGQDEHN